jgi:hypothetical protein
VLRCVALGMSNDQIARRLVITPGALVAPAQCRIHGPRDVRRGLLRGTEGTGGGPYIRQGGPFMTYKRLAQRLGLGAACFAVASLAVGAPAATAQQDGYSPGANGIGDPYFPLEGNGGYDV